MKQRLAFCVATDSPGREVTTRGDAAQLDQVLINLVRNAVDATLDGATLPVHRYDASEDFRDASPGFLLRSLPHPVHRQHWDIDDNGDLISRVANDKTERRALLPRLEKPEWLDLFSKGHV